jgi:mannose-6-phosphate isomerase-like protein (cupin superfamily)
MTDVTYAIIDEMEAIYDGIARRARAELGVTSWGMQVMTLPPNWDGYPNHNHGRGTQEVGQEEVYVPLDGSGLLVADHERFELRPGVMVRVGPNQHRRIVPGDCGVRFLALGGIPGGFTPSAWTRLGGPLPMQPGS